MVSMWCFLMARPCHSAPDSSTLTSPLPTFRCTVTLPPRLTKSELAIMKPLWEWGTASIRDIWVAFPEHTRPAYTTVQTTMCRLETKRAVRRFAKAGKAHVFAPLISRDVVLRRLIDDCVALVEGRTYIVLMYLLDSGSQP